MLLISIKQYIVELFYFFVISLVNSFAEIWSKRVHHCITPTMKMKDLNIAQVQMMEIIKAVSYNSRVIIMDEPTSSLSEKETETLFGNEKKMLYLIGICGISKRLIFFLLDVL